MKHVKSFFWQAGRSAVFTKKRPFPKDPWSSSPSSPLFKSRPLRSQPKKHLSLSYGLAGCLLLSLGEFWRRISRKPFSLIDSVTTQHSFSERPHSPPDTFRTRRLPILQGGPLQGPGGRLLRSLQQGPSSAAVQPLSSVLSITNRREHHERKRERESEEGDRAHHSGSEEHDEYEPGSVPPSPSLGPVTVTAAAAALLVADSSRDSFPSFVPAYPSASLGRASSQGAPSLLPSSSSNSPILSSASSSSVSRTPSSIHSSPSLSPSFSPLSRPPSSGAARSFRPLYPQSLPPVSPMPSEFKPQVQLHRQRPLLSSYRSDHDKIKQHQHQQHQQQQKQLQEKHAKARHEADQHHHSHHSLSCSQHGDNFRARTRTDGTLVLWDEDLETIEQWQALGCYLARSNIVSLRLEGVRIGLSEIEALGSSIPVRDLTFFRNSLGMQPAAVEALVSLLLKSPDLKALSICSNSLRAAQASSLAELATEHPSLQILNLAMNALGDEGAEHFADQHGILSESLLKLDLGYNSIGPKGMAALQRTNMFCQQSGHRLDINLRGNTPINVFLHEQYKRRNIDPLSSFALQYALRSGSFGSGIPSVRPWAFSKF